MTKKGNLCGTSTAEEDIVNAKSLIAGVRNDVTYSFGHFQHWDSMHGHYAASLAQAAAVIAQFYSLHIQQGRSYKACPG